MLDTLAVALAAATEPSAVMAADYVPSVEGRQSARVWLTGRRTSAEQAALANGTAAHALDFDDASVVSRCHPSIVLVPALFSLAETRNMSVGDVEDAYAVGFDVLTALGRWIGPDHYLRGWHATSTLGAIAGAAAASRLLGLSQEKAMSALGLAVSQAAGTHANFGSMAKPLQAGNAAAASVRSALLAEAGFTASQGVLEGKAGLAALYGGDPSAAFEALPGTAGERADIEVKLYPACYATHRAIAGLLRLVRDHQFEPSDVSRIEVEVQSGGLAPLLSHLPSCGSEGKFSIEYCLAAALHDGRVSLSSFSDRAVLRSELHRTIEKVSAREGGGPPLPRWARVVVDLADGRQLQEDVAQIPGSAGHPLSTDALIQKASESLRFGGWKAEQGLLHDFLKAPAGRPVAELLDLLLGLQRRSG